MAALVNDMVLESEPLELQRERLHLDASHKDFFAGAVAGALAISTTQPLDIVRVRLQQSAAARPLGAGMQRGVLGSLQHMIRSEGLLSPFKGMAMPLVFAALQEAIIFNIYGSTTRLLQHMDSCSKQETSSSSSNDGASSSYQLESTSESTSDRVIPTPWVGFVAGCAAGLGQAFIGGPVEVVKLRLQLQTESCKQPGYIGPMQMLRHIVRSEGVVPGLYRGFSVTVLRDIPSYGVYFGSYHALVGLLEGPGVHPEDAAPTTLALAGGAAGCAAWTSIYGLDVIKSRMQATTRAADGGRSWLDYGRAIVAEEGWRGFTRGMAPTLVRAFFMDAAAFLGYTYSLRALHEL